MDGRGGGAGAGLLLPAGRDRPSLFWPGGEVSLGELPHWIAQAFAPGQFGLPVFASLILVALPLIFLGGLAVYRTARAVAADAGFLCGDAGLFGVVALVP